MVAEGALSQNDAGARQKQFALRLHHAERLAQTDPFKQIGDYVGSGPMRFAKSEWRARAKAVSKICRLRAEAGEGVLALPVAADAGRPHRMGW